MCAAIASCNSTDSADDIPLVDGPFEAESSWWIPTGAWSYDLPCGAFDDPAPTVDIDDDGIADGFALGPPTTDESGDTVQAVCIFAEAHLIVNGRSVGKCPWLGGRNRVLTYYGDEDCNGEIDDDDGDGRPNVLGWTVVVSADGPLPPIAGVSLGETIEIGGEVVEVTADNYAELVDPFGIPVDNDQDGLVDVSAYYYHGEEVTKRHFEIEPRSGDVTEVLADLETFEPTAPFAVPDDRSAQLPAVANVAIEHGWLPAGIVARTMERLEVDGHTYAIAAEVTHALPVEVAAMRDGFMFHFVPLRSEGSIRLQIDHATRTARGWIGLPTVFLDGERVSDASHDDVGTVVVEAEFLAEHSMALEVRFATKG